MLSRQQQGTLTPGIFIRAPRGDEAGSRLRDGVAKQAAEHFHGSCHYLFCGQLLRFLQQGTPQSFRLSAVTTRTEACSKDLVAL